jgi:hypothetical protein
MCDDFPRNVLPQANAGQIDLEGFHNIRFWGDASAPAIETIVMAGAPKTLTQSSPASNFLAISGGAEDGCACRKSNSHIQMMKSAEKWLRQKCDQRHVVPVVN